MTENVNKLSTKEPASAVPKSAVVRNPNQKNLVVSCGFLRKNGATPKSLSLHLLLPLLIIKNILPGKITSGKVIDILIMQIN